MIITGAALSTLLQTCAPSVAPKTMSAIVQVESGANPLAIGDNTTGRSYTPRSYAAALVMANALLAKGHSVDVGIAQVNSRNFRDYRVDAATMLFPCQNLIVASAILTGAYRWSSATFADPRRALWGAVSSYNTGSLFAGAAYVKKVVAEAERAPLVPSIDLLQSPQALAQAPAPIVWSPYESHIDIKPRPKKKPRAFAIVTSNATNLAIIVKGQK